MKLAGLFILILLFCSCSTLRRPADEWMMTPEERINKYEQEIKNYEFLIEQEKIKIEKRKL